MWKRIFSHLKENNIKVYSPNQHKGECTENYVVVKDGGITEIPGISSYNQVYELLIYVNKNAYSEIDQYVNQIKGIMLKLHPMVRFEYRYPSSYYDEEKKAHLITLTYINHRRKEYQ